MATEPACFDFLYVNDGYFPSSLQQNELQDEILLASLADAQFAEELQFQEALKASLITCQMPSNMSSSSSSRSMAMEAIPGPSSVPSMNVKEKGESSLSFCEICMERKENNQIIKNGSSVLACCLDCSKIIELSNEQWHSDESFMKTSLGTDSKRPFCSTSKNPSPKVKTEPLGCSATHIISLSSAQDENRANSSIPVGRTNSVSHSTCTSFNWQSFCGSASEDGQEKVANEVGNSVAADNEHSDSVALDDNDEFDSDTNQESYETCRKSLFLERLETMTTEEINDPARQWHCLACEGATKHYKGLQAFMSHAKTKGGKRVKLHRLFAQLLEEKLHGEETSAIPADEVFSKWKGLKDEKNDHEILWPPMVVIRNTSLKKDGNNKWIGMTSQDLLDFFSPYDAIVKAQHAYNSQGHCGMSLLIFESSAAGYLEAERLHKHFAEQGTGRDAWHHCPVYFLPGGERQLYGYMAMKEDVDIFNQHSRGKSKLKYEIRSYQDMVVNRIRQMSEDNHQLIWLRNRVGEQERHAKVLEESIDVMRERLHNAMKEIHILRQEINLHHEQHREEMDFQEKFLSVQMKHILEARDENERDFENAKQEEKGHENVEQSNDNPSKTQNYDHRMEETAKSIMSKEKEKNAGHCEIDKDKENEKEEIVAENNYGPVKGKDRQNRNKGKEEVELGRIFNLQHVENLHPSEGNSIVREARRLKAFVHQILMPIPFLKTEREIKRES